MCDENPPSYITTTQPLPTCTSHDDLESDLSALISDLTSIPDDMALYSKYTHSNTSKIDTTGHICVYSGSHPSFSLLFTPVYSDTRYLK